MNDSRTIEIPIVSTTAFALFSSDSEKGLRGICSISKGMRYRRKTPAANSSILVLGRANANGDIFLRYIFIFPSVTPFFNYQVVGANRQGTAFPLPRPLERRIAFKLLVIYQ